MPTIEHLPAAATGTEAAAVLARDGVVVVDALVAPSVMDAVRAELAPFLDATPFGPDDFSGRRTRRTGGLIARSATCRELVMHPLALGTARELLLTRGEEKTKKRRAPCRPTVRDHPAAAATAGGEGA